MRAGDVAVHGIRTVDGRRVFGGGGRAHIALAGARRMYQRHAGVRIRDRSDGSRNGPYRHLRAADGARHGLLGAPAADGGRLPAVVHAIDGIPAVVFDRAVYYTSRRLAARGHVVFGGACGAECRAGLYLHLSRWLGRAGRGLRHVAQRRHGRRDGDGLPALLCPHAAARARQAEREEPAPYAAQPRLPVPYRVVDAARGADAGDAHVCG